MTKVLKINSIKQQTKTYWLMQEIIYSIIVQKPGSTRQPVQIIALKTYRFLTHWALFEIEALNLALDGHVSKCDEPAGKLLI